MTGIERERRKAGGLSEVPAHTAVGAGQSGLQAEGDQGEPALPLKSEVAWRQNALFLRGGQSAGCPRPTHIRKGDLLSSQSTCLNVNQIHKIASKPQPE